MSKSFCCICVLLILGGSAVGIINMQMTPRQLVDVAGTVMVGTLAKNGEQWTLHVNETIKGKTSATVNLDLSRTSKDEISGIQALLAENISRPAVLITSKRLPIGNLHIGGQWLEVAGAGSNQWHITKNAPALTGTFAGGTDMLARMLKHLADHPDATVPVTVGVKWTDNCIAGKVPDATALAVIEWPKPDKPALFVASPAGDRLLAPKDKENAFEDVTSAAGISSKSMTFAFLDVDGDGLADLVSYDGAAITLYPARDQFKAAGAKWTWKTGNCIGLAPLSFDGRPAVLVSSTGAPTLLVAQENGWKLVTLPPFEANIGRVSPCIVADLDNDGYADILQPGETAGMLWKGSEHGFLAPVKSSVCTGGGSARHTVADFNEDGFADIFLSAAEKNSLWENDGKGAFSDVLRYAGSLSNKCPPNAPAILAMDLNHDGRADLCLGYSNGDFVYHFNRGFRSMGEERELRLSGAEPRAGSDNSGLRSFAVADFNDDNSADLAVLQGDGTIRVYFNERADAPALMLRLPKGMTGPVTLSCRTDEKIPTFTGFAIITGHAPGVYLPIREKGAVHLNYRFPGQPPATMSVTVGDSVGEVIVEPKGNAK